MFLTSGDILNWVLAISAIALTFFLCWAIYYFVVATHKFYRIIKRVEAGVAKAEDILETIQSKVKGSAPYMMVIGELIKQSIEFVKDKKTSKRKTQSSKKAK